MSIQNFLNSVNVWSKCGSVNVQNGEDREVHWFDDLRDDDVVIYYDWVNDELSGDEKEKFHWWFCDEFFKNLHIGMKNSGYELVFNDDGSGNGLYYGCQIYRKK